MASDSPFAKGTVIVDKQADTPQQIALAIKEERQQSSIEKQMEKFQGLQSFDWKQIPPPMVASIIVQIPFRGSGTDPDFYLAPWQAMILAIRCFELGLSPFSNEVWFNPKNNKVNLTFEGKLKLARISGLNLSPPKFTRIPAEGSQERLVGGKKIADYAYKAVITSPSGDSEYTAWWSEWNVGSSPVWKAKPEHMLQLRAAEKCLSFATGTGASELPDEGDLQVGVEASRAVPETAVSSTEFKQGED